MPAPAESAALSPASPAPAETAAVPPAPPAPAETVAVPPASPAPAETVAVQPAPPAPAEVVAVPPSAPADQPPAEEIKQAAPSPADGATGDAPAIPAVADSQNAPATQAKADDGLMRLIGQMVITGFEGAEPGDPGVKAVIEQLRQGLIAGVVVAAHNVRGTGQLRALVAALRDAGGETAPFLMIAHEGGAGQAMTPEKGFSAYPSAAALGRSDDPLNAFNVYRYMAEELAAYGFNVNLGPVVDLDPATEVADSAVEGRSYGVVPKHVAAFAKAFRLAHHEKSILTALKHFPPLAAGVPSPDAETETADPLHTFRALIEGGDADLVMTSNLPQAGDTGEGEGALAASLTAGLVQKQLREQLGFDGVVLSGDLEAAEIASRWSLEERVTRALDAGNDILLAGIGEPPAPDLAASIAAAISSGVANGTIGRDALEASHGRIARLKASLTSAGNAVASAAGKKKAAAH
jgi:beta-N-acetylhexosaminidase